LLHWSGKIKGPVGTPYEGGIFQVRTRIITRYIRILLDTTEHSVLLANQFWGGRTRVSVILPWACCLQTHTKLASKPATQNLDEQAASAGHSCGGAIYPPPQ